MMDWPFLFGQSRFLPKKRLWVEMFYNTLIFKDILCPGYFRITNYTLESFFSGRYPEKQALDQEE